MKREDGNLPFLLRYENVAWYENGKVKILDRRVYPTEVVFVECTTYTEVAQAITDMVTQSAGPYTAAGMGMALAAYECRDQNPADQILFLEKASHVISTARPTTANRMGKITSGCLVAAQVAIANNEPADHAIFMSTIESLNRRYATMNKVARHLLVALPEDCNLLTQCFGETIIGMLCREAQEQQKKIHFFCAETRPFLQGARLTASCCAEMGFETTVLTDNMILFGFEHLNINAYTSAADTIAKDGYIANKIGTKQIAMLAQQFEIPYFVTGIPDTDKESGKDIVIEMRDPAQVLECHGIKHTLAGVDAVYPSFDITPASLIGGIVTDKGIFSPYDLDSYFKTEVQQFY